MVNKTRISQLQRLVETYLPNRSDYIRADSNFNETELRNDFLDPFLEILGWDVRNQQGAPQHLREVVHEDSVDVEEEAAQKKPDYALRVGMKRKIFIEAKSPSVPITYHQGAAFQLRRYGWNGGLAVSVLTNFDKLIIYDTRYRPNADDDARIARIKVYDCTEYVDHFDEIYEQLSRESVYSGRFDELFDVEAERAGTESFDEYFLSQIERWRLMLSGDIVSRNSALSQEELNFVVQMILNRIIFLRICEDRELENYRSLQNTHSYDELKALFDRAENRYDSGLFDFIEDTLTPGIDIGDDVLISIFSELYYPDSPYAFSVVEASVLGEIYELFLAKEIRLEDGITVVEKPEVVAAGGVVSTPNYIVDSIIQRTVAPALDGKSPDELTDFYVADIACGSGTFLLAAYEALLNHYIEWYLKDGPDNHRERVYEVGANQWRLTLQEKRRILLQHIYGVDVDHQAVEVARFSLLLKVTENETAASVDALLRRNHLRALPNLNENVRCGNSLLDERFFQYNPSALHDEDLTNRLNPFDWHEAFPRVFSSGGFDVIVGNPPYIRIQNMVHYSPDEVSYYQARRSPYSTAHGNNFDKYGLFIERALLLLKPTGLLGYIVPHKFFVTKAGRALRRLIAGNHYLHQVVHFGTEQVFGRRRTTYTCILVLTRQPSSEFSVEHVTDLTEWRREVYGSIRQYSSDDINEDSWVFVSLEAEAIFQRLRSENPTPLESVAEILVGVQTSADPIYVIRPTSETPTHVEFVDKDGGQRSIEKAILRPCIYKAELPAYSLVHSNAYVLFPYEVSGNRARLFSEEELAISYPLCWEYLNAYRDELLKRSIQGFTDATWYRYGRSQSLTKFEEGEKLIWYTLSLFPRYAYDPDNVIYLGGGNGPYYGLRMRQSTQLSIFYIQAILSHPVIEALVSSRASVFRGGYRSHGKQFMANLPIRTIDFNDASEVAQHDEIVRLVKELLGVTEKLRRPTLPHRRSTLLRSYERLRRRIEALVGDLYNISDNELESIGGLLGLTEDPDENA